MGERQGGHTVPQDLKRKGKEKQWRLMTDWPCAPWHSTTTNTAATAAAARIVFPTHNTKGFVVVISMAVSFAFVFCANWRFRQLLLAFGNVTPDLFSRVLSHSPTAVNEATAYQYAYARTHHDVGLKVIERLGNTIISHNSLVISIYSRTASSFRQNWIVNPKPGQQTNRNYGES